MRVALLIAAVLGALLIGSSYLPRSRPAPSKKADDVAHTVALAADSRIEIPHRMAGPRGTWLAITYGGNGLGEIEPCG